MANRADNNLGRVLGTGRAAIPHAGHLTGNMLWAMLPRKGEEMRSVRSLLARTLAIVVDILRRRTRRPTEDDEPHWV